MQGNEGLSGEKRDLVISPGEFAYLQEITQGVIKTHVGPTVVNQTAQDRPTIFDHKNRKFDRCSLDNAVVRSPFASEGDYIVLENPAESDANPEPGTVKVAPKLQDGRKINIPGPISFALWPGQHATVVKGHQLRSYQYLTVRVYNEEAARENWGKAVVKKATGQDGDTTTESKDGADSGETKILGDEAQNLTIGQQLVIKGTEVSFYIPPTGIEVVPDDTGDYVRDAVTLEQLEYAILVDEDGHKRYEKGPQVVFPKPTETFHRDEKNHRKFMAIELNKIQGLHIKVIAAYTDGDEGGQKGESYAEGDELFLTGDDCAIYFPRPEHSIIRYGDSRRHFATAVPSGEGRYVMERETGIIETVKGPKMLLPNPISSVMVRRTLTDTECGLWYPDNSEALLYNRSLRSVADSVDNDAQTGFVTERDVRTKGGVPEADTPIAADEFSRRSHYTRPRELTLDTKFDGVPTISIWTGYAVLVIKKTGERRVELGPKTILLDYDETLEILTLSTGKPKNTDKMYKTAYLRVRNNKVSDVIQDIRTKDHVPLSITLSLRVNFEGAEESWFDCDNYVKFLTDHVRSMIKGRIRKISIEDFYANGVDIVRDIILGEHRGEGEDRKRPGMQFEENGMVVNDVEVLSIHIEDSHIDDIINKAQRGTVEDNIQINRAEQKLVVDKRSEEITQEMAAAKFETASKHGELAIRAIAQQLEKSLADLDREKQEQEAAKLASVAAEKANDVEYQAILLRTQADDEHKLTVSRHQLDMKIDELNADADAMIKRLEAAQPGFSEALLSLSSHEAIEKVAEAMSVQNLLGGRNVVEVMNGIFAGSPLEGNWAKIGERAMQTLSGGRRKTRETATSE